MKTRLSTFSFDRLRKPILAALVFVVAVVAFDRLVFYPLFFTYDLMYRASSIAEPNEVFIVGSSALQRAIDLSTLQSALKKNVGAVVLPMSDAVVRYHALKERLENAKLPRPKLIVLETARFFLNQSEHGDNTALLMPYYHVGMMRELVETHPPRKRDWLLNRLFHSYSFNFQFAQNSFDPVQFGRYLLEKFDDVKLLDRARAWANRSQRGAPAATEAALPEERERVAGWRDLMKSLPGYSSDLDPKLVAEFESAIDLARRHGVPVLLLEPPIFHFAEEKVKDELASVRSMLKHANDPRIHYLSVKTSGSSVLFEDPHHLRSRYRVYYTKLLSAALQREVSL